METQKILQELSAIHQWMKDHERHDDQRFGDGRAKMDMLASKEDIQNLRNIFLDDRGDPKFADKEDVARLNNYVQTFTFALEVLKGGGKFFYYALIAIATIMGAWAVVSGGLKAAGDAFLHSIFH